MKSGIICSEVMSMATRVGNISVQMNQLIESLSKEAVSGLRECYSGAAADTFNEVLQTQLKKIAQVVTNMSTKLRTEAQKQWDGYNDRDKQMSAQTR